MLGVDVGEQPVADAQLPGCGAALDLQRQHRVGAVAVRVDQLFAGFDAAGLAIGFERQPSQCIGRNVGMALAQLAPGDDAVAVGIQADDLVQVAQRDVPAAFDVPGGVAGAQAEPRVRGLVRQRRQQRQQQQAGGDEALHQRGAFAAAASRCERRVAVAGVLHPVQCRRGGARLLGSQRGFEQQPRVRGFALQLEVLRCQLQRARRIALQHEHEARLFLLVQRIAALCGRVEARRQLGAPARRFRRAQRLGGDGRAQQQRIGTRAVLQQQQHVSRPALVEQQVGIGGQQVGVAGIQGQRVAVGGLGRDQTALALFGFGQSRQRPQALVGIGIAVLLQRLAQRCRGGVRPAGERIDLRQAGAADQRRGQRRQPLAGLSAPARRRRAPG